MALTSDQITAQNFKDFYGQIRPYLNGAAHAGFTPVGTVISVMGKQAPLNYLVCDGTVYNIKDYPELAAYFAGQFEVSNFFGGDGETTFAVPDLRGEFLRGTGKNSHANQGSGGAVGEHQDGTDSPYYNTDRLGHIVVNETFTKPQNTDATKNKTTGDWYWGNTTKVTTQDYTLKTYTSRPTNTSVLYCIATKNIFMDAGQNYSTDERPVGTWIDGKPIYQKTVIGTLNSTGFDNSIIITNIDEVIDIKGIVNQPSGAATGGINKIPLNFINLTGNYHTGVYFRKGTNSINIECTSQYAGFNYVVTIQYTKTTD